MPMAAKCCLSFLYLDHDGDGGNVDGDEGEDDGDEGEVEDDDEDDDGSVDDVDLSLHCECMCGSLRGEDTADVKSSRLVV